MKLLLAVFLCFPSVCEAQWRPVSVTSDTTKAIQENFRRASLWSNRKLDRFSNDTLYGKYTFTGHVNGNGGMTVSTLTVTGSDFSVGGSTLVVTGGKVGIGTTSPDTKLDIYSAVNTDKIRMVVPHAAGLVETGAEFIRDTQVAGAKIQTIRNASLGGIGLDFYTTADQAAEAAGTYNNRMTIDRGGNIGIGDTVPQAKLTVNGNIHSSGTISATTFIGPAVLVATQTFTGINTFISSASFSGATSTVTFHGWVDIGRELIVGADSGSATATASCTGGKNLIGGGCGGNATMASSYPQDADTWYCNAPGATALSAYLICARVK